MDPPSYGRGPSGEIWKLEKDLYPFVQLTRGVLSDNPLFMMMNSYTTGLAPSCAGIHYGYSGLGKDSAAAADAMSWACRSGDRA